MGKKWGRTAAIFEESMDDIAQDFEGGAELKEIAAKYEVSPPTITNWLIKAGYKHRTKGRYPKAMKERAVDLQARGWNPIAIANLFKTKIEYVNEWLGLPRATGRMHLVPDMESEYKRHVTGRRWTDAQKDEVIRLLSTGVFSVGQIYRITNASRVRQQRIWAEIVGAPFPMPKERFEREPSDLTSAEVFQQGRIEGIKEARQLALEAGDEGQVTALAPIEEGILGATDAEIEEEFRIFEAQKRMLDAAPEGE